MWVKEGKGTNQRQQQKRYGISRVVSNKLKTSTDRIRIQKNPEFRVDQTAGNACDAKIRHCLRLTVFSDEMAAWYSGWTAAPRFTILHRPSSRVASTATLGEHHNVANEVDRLVEVPPSIGRRPGLPHYYSKDVSQRDIGVMK